MRTLLLLALLTPVSLRADEFDDAIALARDAL
jgi:hypothetical protein